MRLDQCRKGRRYYSKSYAYAEKVAAFDRLKHQEIGLWFDSLLEESSYKSFVVGRKTKSKYL